MKKELNYNNVRRDKSLRFQIYQEVLEYYYSRIQENELLRAKPWYYGTLLHCFDLKPRYRRYDALSSDISFIAVLNILYPGTVHVSTRTFVQHYFPELFNKRYISEYNYIFKNDQQRIQALESIVYHNLRGLENETKDM